MSFTAPGQRREQFRGVTWPEKHSSWICFSKIFGMISMVIFATKNHQKLGFMMAFGNHESSAINGQLFSSPALFQALPTAG